ncbi:MAG: hypothetical protein P9L88_01380 [Candidatus Tantalella remota]|nr:hypothetical protein [Candidatus Tantalella remota]
MKCPDCKIEMEVIDRQIDRSSKADLTLTEKFKILRCPRCYMEIEAGDEDYESDE